MNFLEFFIFGKHLFLGDIGLRLAKLFDELFMGGSWILEIFDHLALALEIGIVLFEFLFGKENLFFLVHF